MIPNESAILEGVDGRQGGLVQKLDISSSISNLTRICKSQGLIFQLAISLLVQILCSAGPDFLGGAVLLQFCIYLTPHHFFCRGS